MVAHLLKRKYQIYGILRNTEPNSLISRIVVALQDVDRHPITLKYRVAGLKKSAEFTAPFMRGKKKAGKMSASPLLFYILRKVVIRNEISRLVLFMILIFNYFDLQEGKENS